MAPMYLSALLIGGTVNADKTTCFPVTKGCSVKINSQIYVPLEDVGCELHFVISVQIPQLVAETKRVKQADGTVVEKKVGVMRISRHEFPAPGTRTTVLVAGVNSGKRRVTLDPEVLSAASEYTDVVTGVTSRLPPELFVTETLLIVLSIRPKETRDDPTTGSEYFLKVVNEVGDENADAHVGDLDVYSRKHRRVIHPLITGKTGSHISLQLKANDFECLVGNPVVY